jgi:hypothetical protein
LPIANGQKRSIAAKPASPWSATTTRTSAPTVLYFRLDAKGRGRIQITAELPLIYATGRRTDPPEVNFPVEAETEDTPRRIRESKLEPQPFLRSLPIYRCSIV